MPRPSRRRRTTAPRRRARPGKTAGAGRRARGRETRLAAEADLTAGGAGGSAGGGPVAAAHPRRSVRAAAAQVSVPVPAAQPAGWGHDLGKSLVTAVAAIRDPSQKARDHEHVSSIAADHAARLLLGPGSGGPSQSAVWRGDLRARFDRRQVHEGDTVTLTIEKDGTGAAGSPDLSALKQDFDVLGTSSGTQIRIVNGVRSDTTSWQVTLSPKRTGVLTVPPIAIGTDSTPAPDPDRERRRPRGPWAARATTSSWNWRWARAIRPWPRAFWSSNRSPLTVRLYSARPLLGGDLSEPRVDDAVVAKLGEDRQYRTQRNGRDYQVVERRYSLSPEKSGDLHIPPVVFKGTVRQSAQARQASAAASTAGPSTTPGFDRILPGPGPGPLLRQRLRRPGPLRHVRARRAGARPEQGGGPEGQGPTGGRRGGPLAAGPGARPSPIPGPRTRPSCGSASPSPAP